MPTPTIAPLTADQLERFWSKVNKDGPIVREELGPCWLWTGSKTTAGYGNLTVTKKSYYARRVSVFIARGIDPSDGEAINICDNRVCVNPDHITIGTHTDVAQETSRKIAIRNALKECVCGDPECQIPFGYCHCECGNKVSILEITRSARGQVKGYPAKFIQGHTGIIKTIHTLPDGICICGDENCEVEYGYCHCRCGEKTTIAKETKITEGVIEGYPNMFKLGHRMPYTTLIEYAAPFKIDGVYCRLIPLTQGQYAIVWESDYYWLVQWKWHSRWSETIHGFYAGRQIRERIGKQNSLSMHRAILGLGKGDPELGDHINGNTLDCRRSNLRLANHAENARNRRMQRNNTSGYKGVSWSNSRGVYVAQIGFNWEKIYLGCSSRAKDAYALYCEASARLHKEFSNLG
jgi:HNH endonuclease